MSIPIDSEAVSQTDAEILHELLSLVEVKDIATVDFGSFYGPVPMLTISIYPSAAMRKHLEPMRRLFEQFRSNA